MEETIRKAGVIRARVQARIAEIMRAGAERAEVTVEQVVRELKLLGFSDIRKVVSWRNELHLGEAGFRPVAKTPLDAAETDPVIFSGMGGVVSPLARGARRSGCRPKPACH